MDFKLNRTVFSMGKMNDVGNIAGYWLSKTMDEGFEAAVYLNNLAFNYDINNPPKMDRTQSRMRKHQC